MRIYVFCAWVALLLFSTSGLDAAPTGAVQRVEFKADKVYLWPGGEVLAAPDEVTLPFGIVIRTNGTFTVKGGKERKLQEGEALGADGMLVKPDGSIIPVMDHASLNRGRVLVMKDGEASEVTSVVRLGDGTTIAPDGKITPRVGLPRQLLDGELFQLEGGALPVRDSVTMQKGRVSVQKDGSKLNVEPDRSITMNDGTKVFGDGTIIKFNGERTSVSEGQIVTLQGVVTRPR
ncbi:MAG TPA: DUF6799 domain-containing protein [Methylomirabilota bacterium]|nr:DUF6799 domain-containing protein [Methylomirabilota bacterium]